MMPTSASTRPGVLFGVPAGFGIDDSAIQMNAKRNTNVKCTRTSTPNNLPIGMDQFLIRLRR